MKKLIFFVLFVMFLVLAYYLYVFTKEKYCYSYKSLDLNKMDSFKIQSGQDIVKNGAWDIYKPKSDTLYDKGYGYIYISKYDIKNMDVLIDLIKKADPNKSFSENFGVIAGFHKGYIFFDNQKIKLPIKEIPLQREGYKNIEKDIFDILDKYVSAHSTIILVSKWGVSESAIFLPLSSITVYDSENISLNEKKRLFKNNIALNKVLNNEYKYIRKSQGYNINEPLLCCDKEHIDKKLESNLRTSKDSGNLNQNGERMDYFDYSVNLDSLDSIKAGDGLDFLDNFHNSSHRFLKREEISLAGKYRAIVEMHHSVYLGIPTLKGSPVNVCKYQ